LQYVENGSLLQGLGFALRKKKLGNP